MTDPVRAIADAVLYEGHVLWPYRRSALKNQQRWTFGGVFPRAWSARHPDDRWTLQAQVLADGEVDVRVRFLQVVHRQAMHDGVPVDAAGDVLTWDEATERELGPGPFSIPAGSDGGGDVVRTWEALSGAVDVRRDGRRVTVRVRNTTPWDDGDRPDAQRRAFCSTHAVLRTTGAFVSPLDPQAASCVSEGWWPVLVGEPGSADTVLASPIILEDHPRIAPESPGDFFDGGEIDQMLVLNLLALTDAEREEVRASDPRAREVLERTEAMTPEQIARLSGAIREFGMVR